ncbi:MAG: glycosyltransferase family 2 protein [Desulfurococcaceae archaeon]
MNCVNHPRGVTLVTVNYNSSGYINSLIDSVKNSLDKCGSCFTLEIIIVDNASDYDDYHSLLEIINKHNCDHDISIRVIRNRRNYGYAGGVNIGVKTASYDTVIVSNPDIILREDFFQKLSRLSILHRSDYLIVPKILLKQSTRVNSKGLFIHAAGYGLLRGLYEQDKKNHDKVDYVLSPHGALFISSRETLQKLGPFDTSLYSFLEDLDLGLRAYLHGYRVIYIPYLVAYHDWGVSWGLKLSSVKYYLSERNRLIILTRDLQGRFVIASLPFILVSELISFVYSVKAHYPYLKALVYADLLKSLPKIIKEKKKLKSLDYRRLLSILVKESTWRFNHVIFEDRYTLVVNKLYRDLSYLTRFIWPWRD